MKRNLIYIILSTILLSSCMVGPKFQKIDVATPETYRFSHNADTVLNLKWWELFNDKNLLSLIDTALVNNKDLLIAASRIEEAKYNVGYTRADAYPDLGYSGSYAYGNENTIATTGDPVKSWSAAGSLSWEIGFWGKFRRATQAAKASLLATEYGKRSVQMELINTICNTYFSLLDYHNRLEIAKRTLESRSQSLRIIEERYEKGTVPEIDLNQAQIQEAIAKAAIPNYERAIVYAENSLNLLLGKNPHEIRITLSLEEEILPPAIPNGIPSQLLTRRPDILIAEQNVKAQNAKIGVAQAMRFPSLSLTGLGGYAAFDANEDILMSAAGGLFGPIFHFGKNKRLVQMERERTNQLKFTYENTVINAFCETENALIAIQTIQKELDAVEIQVKAASNAAALSRQRYDGGVTSYLEVLDSERQLFNVELQHSELMQNRLTAYVNLYKTLGGGWLPREE